MSRQVILELPNEVVERAEQLAQMSSRDLSDVLVEAVSNALPPLGVLTGETQPVASLPDGEVMKLADLQLPPVLDRRLSSLLGEQKAGTITRTGQTELHSLMQVYQARLLQKAEALSEAVRRGLRPPLDP